MCAKCPKSLVSGVCASIARDGLGHAPLLFEKHAYTDVSLWIPGRLAQMTLKALQGSSVLAPLEAANSSLVLIRTRFPAGRPFGRLRPPSPGAVTGHRGTQTPYGGESAPTAFVRLQDWAFCRDCASQSSSFHSLGRERL